MRLCGYSADNFGGWKGNLLIYWSERGDLNSRPPVPQTGALTRLRYAPDFISMIGDVRFLILGISSATRQQRPHPCRCVRPFATPVNAHRTEGTMVTGPAWAVGMDAAPRLSRHPSIPTSSSPGLVTLLTGSPPAPKASRERPLSTRILLGLSSAAPNRNRTANFCFRSSRGDACRGLWGAFFADLPSVFAWRQSVAGSGSRANGALAGKSADAARGSPFRGRIRR
jgi:hypothetical protein